MSFYTSVNRKANYIYYRGYNDSGVQIGSKVKFQPTLYFPDEDSPFLALDGTHVAPKKYETMGAAKEVVEKSKELDGFKVYGMDRWPTQFIAEKWPGSSANLAENLEMLPYFFAPNKDEQWLQYP